MSRLRLVAVGIGMSLVAGACGALSPESLAFVDEVDRREETVIRLATYDTVGLSEAIELWEREHPTATVVVERRGFDDHHSTVLDPRTDTIAPDVIAYDVAYAAAMRDRSDLFADLRLLGGTAYRRGSLDWRWDSAVAEDDRLIALPVDLAGSALAFRVDLVDEELAERLGQVADWCEFLVAGDHYSDLTEQAFLPRAADIFEAALDQAPRRFHDIAGEPIHDSNPDLQQAWDLAMRSLGEAPLFADPCPGVDGIDRFSANVEFETDEWSEGLRNGDFAAVIAGVDRLGVIQAEAPETAGAWTVVAVPGLGGNRAGMNLGVRDGSPHADLAYDLVAFLAEPSTQLRVFEELGRFPVATSTYDDPRVLEHRRAFFGDSPIGLVYAESARATISAPDGPDRRIFEREFRGAVSRVESGNQTPREAWDEAMWRIVQVLD